MRLGESTACLIIYLTYDLLPLSNEDTLYVRKLNGSYLELVGDYRGASRAYSDFASSVMNYGEDLITDPPTVMLAETLRVAMTQEKAISGNTGSCRYC